MERKLKHLELIQGVINRLSTSSSLLKGWSVVIVSAFLALAVHQLHSGFVYLAYIPVVVFWGLDGYFLRQERLYRALYNQVRVKPDSDIDFSMDTTEFEGTRSVTWLSVVSSGTLVAFHGALIVAVLTVTGIAVANGG